MHKQSYYIINGITIYRIVTAPILLYLIFIKEIEWFKYLLAASFFTDAIDGYLARRFKATSILGSRLDSIGDDLTVAAAFAGIVFLKTTFVTEEIGIFAGLFGLYVFQNGVALFKYRKTTSFHTYLAKIAAVLQATFLILIFFTKDPFMPLFYAASAFTAIDLLEEIIMIFLIPEWKSDIKGIYWALKLRK